MPTSWRDARLQVQLAQEVEKRQLVVASSLLKISILEHVHSPLGRGRGDLGHHDDVGQVFSRDVVLLLIDLYAAGLCHRSLEPMHLVISGGQLSQAPGPAAPLRWVASFVQRAWDWRCSVYWKSDLLWLMSVLLVLLLLRCNWHKGRGGRRVG